MRFGTIRWRCDGEGITSLVYSLLRTHLEVIFKYGVALKISNFVLRLGGGLFNSVPHLQHNVFLSVMLGEFRLKRGNEAWVKVSKQEEHWTMVRIYPLGRTGRFLLLGNRVIAESRVRNGGREHICSPLQRPLF